MTAINTPFLVTGGETNRLPTNAFSPSQRQINIRAPFSVPSADQWTGEMRINGLVKKYGC